MEVYWSKLSDYCLKDDNDLRSSLVEFYWSKLSYYCLNDDSDLRSGIVEGGLLV